MWGRRLCVEGRGELGEKTVRGIGRGTEGEVFVWGRGTVRGRGMRGETNRGREGYRKRGICVGEGD